MKLSSAAKALIALTLIIAAGVLHIALNVTDYFGRGSDLRWVNTRRGVSYTHDASPVFHGFESPFFFIASRDGVRNVTQQGENRWHSPLNLRRPIMRGQGQYAAVTEGERGRSVHVFNENGLAFTENFDYPVHTFSVNRTGFLSVILQMDDGYMVKAYHHLSAYRPMFRIILRENDHPGIIPVMTEMSNDGRYIAVGFIDFRNRLQSKVQFLYTYQGDGWGTDGVFAEFILQDQMLLFMRKTENNRLVVATDTQIVVYTRDANDIIHTTALIPLHNQITEMAFDENGRFAVALGTPFLNAPQAEPPGTVLIFSENGTQIGTHNANRRVTHLSMGHDALIVGCERNFVAITLTGDFLWEYVALQDTHDFFFLENNNTVLIAGATRAETWRRQRPRDGEEADFFGILGQEQ